MTAIDKLAALNAFRLADGKKAIAAWKASRHTPQLEAYQEEAAKQAPKGVVSPSIVAPSAPDRMRPINEELGADIKATRAAWKASGANVTKKEFAMDLMFGGISIKGLVDKMGITETAARSLVGDVRAVKGAIVTRADGMYFLEMPVEDEDEGDE